MGFNEVDIKSLLDLYLPAHYSEEVIKRLSANGIAVNKSTVQNVRNGRKAKNKSAILTILVDMANREKRAIEHISKQLN